MTTTLIQIYDFTRTIETISVRSSKQIEEQEPRAVYSWRLERTVSP